MYIFDNLLTQLNTSIECHLLKRFADYSGTVLVFQIILLQFQQRYIQKKLNIFSKLNEKRYLHGF